MATKKISGNKDRNNKLELIRRLKRNALIGGSALVTGVAFSSTGAEAGCVRTTGNTWFCDGTFTADTNFNDTIGGNASVIVNYLGTVSGSPVAQTGYASLDGSFYDVALSFTGLAGSYIDAYTTGDTGLTLYTHANTITVNSATNIDAWWNGIYARTDFGGSISITNSGTIDAGNSNDYNDPYTYGIAAVADDGGNIGIANTGNIGVVGSNDYFNDDYASNGAFGLYGRTPNGFVTITNTNANISVYTNSVYAGTPQSSQAYTEAAGISAGTNFGSVIIANNGASNIGVTTEGAYAYSDNDAYAYTNAKGIDAFSYGGGDVSISNQGGVSVVTGQAFADSYDNYAYTDAIAYGISALANGNISIINSGDVSVYAGRDNPAAAYSTGDFSYSAAYSDAAGLRAFVGPAGGDITINNSGTVQVATRGTSANGFYGAYTENTAYGVYADGEGANDISVTNTGYIGVTNAAASAVKASGNTYVDGNAYAFNGTAGIWARSYTDGVNGGNVDVSNSGWINVNSGGAVATETGYSDYGYNEASANAETIGINAYANDGAATVNNAGMITVSSAAAIATSDTHAYAYNYTAGISAESYFGNVSVENDGLIKVMNAGSIASAGYTNYGAIANSEAIGIDVYNSLGGDVYVANRGDILIENRGATANISWSDEADAQSYSAGVRIETYGNAFNDVFVGNAGNILVSDGGATATSLNSAYAESIAYGMDLDGDGSFIEVVNNGTIDVESGITWAQGPGYAEAYSHADGVIASTYFANIEIYNQGAVNVFGNSAEAFSNNYATASSGAHGLNARAYEGDVYVSNAEDASITVASAGAMALSTGYAYADSEVGGVKAAADTEGFTGNGNVQVDNAGAINAASGPAYARATGSGDADAYSGAFGVEAYGNSDQSGGGGNVTVNNYAGGTIVAAQGLATAVANSGDAESDGDATAVEAEANGGVLTVNNSGLISGVSLGASATSTTGNDADADVDAEGIDAYNNAGDILITNDTAGSIIGLGQVAAIANAPQGDTDADSHADGITASAYAWEDGEGDLNGGNILILSNGLISATDGGAVATGGAFAGSRSIAHGIFAQTDGGNIDIAFGVDSLVEALNSDSVATSTGDFARARSEVFGLKLRGYSDRDGNGDPVGGDIDLANAGAITAFAGSSLATGNDGAYAEMLAAGVDARSEGGNILIGNLGLISSDHGGALATGSNAFVSAYTSSFGVDARSSADYTDGVPTGGDVVVGNFGGAILATGAESTALSTNASADAEGYFGGINAYSSGGNAAVFNAGQLDGEGFTIPGTGVIAAGNYFSDSYGAFADAEGGSAYAFSGTRGVSATAYAATDGGDPIVNADGVPTGNALVTNTNGGQIISLDGGAYAISDNEAISGSGSVGIGAASYGGNTLVGNGATFDLGEITPLGPVVLPSANGGLINAAAWGAQAYGDYYAEAFSYTAGIDAYSQAYNDQNGNVLVVNNGGIIAGAPLETPEARVAAPIGSFGTAETIAWANGPAEAVDDTYGVNAESNGGNVGVVSTTGSVIAAGSGYVQATSDSEGYAFAESNATGISAHANASYDDEDNKILATGNVLVANDGLIFVRSGDAVASASDGDAEAFSRAYGIDAGGNGQAVVVIADENSVIDVMSGVAESSSEFGDAFAATRAIGIYAHGEDGANVIVSNAGLITVDNADRTTGTTTGIYAESDGGSVGVSNTGVINSLNGRGIEAYVYGGNGNLGVDNQGEINAYGDGIRAVSTAINDGFDDGVPNGGNIIIANGPNASIFSETGYGIYAEIDNVNSAGNIYIDNAGVIDSALDGIKAFTNGTGNVFITYDQDITTPLDGIFAQTPTGDIEIAYNSVMNAGQNGIRAVTGVNPGTGLPVPGTGGAVDITVGADGRVTGGWSGIYVENYGNQQTTITNYGTVIGAGTFDGDGGMGTHGSLVNGKPLNAGGGDPVNFAVIAINNGGGVPGIDNEGAVGGSSQTKIYNWGTIQNTNGDLNALAVATSYLNDGYNPNDILIVNNGTMIGRFDLTNNPDTFINNGRWLVNGTNNFYNSIGGADIFQNNGTMEAYGHTDMNWGVNSTGIVNNTGVIAVRDLPGETGQLAFLDNVGAGAEPDWVATGNHENGSIAFDNNGGLITMANGNTANWVYIDGNYNGRNGAQLAVDTVLASGQSDRLGVSGNVTGNTAIQVNSIGPGSLNPIGTTLVAVGGAGGAGNFSIASSSAGYNPFTGSIDRGFFSYSLINNNGAAGCNAGFHNGDLDNPNTCVALASRGNIGLATQAAVAGTAARSLWYDTTLLWEDRQSEVRGLLLGERAVAPSSRVVKGPAPVTTMASPTMAVWAKGMGAWTTRNWGVGGGEGLYSNLGYNQNSFSVLGGADWTARGVLGANDALIVGALGGYTNSNVSFRQGGTNYFYQGGTVGATATYLNSGFFVDGLIKADILNLQMNMPVLTTSGWNGGSTGVTTWGLMGNAGYHWNFAGSAFLEPILTLAYANTSLGNINMPGMAASMSWNRADSFRGALGGRLGVSAPPSMMGSMFASKQLDLSVTGRVWQEWSNTGTGVQISNPGIPLLVADYFGGTFGEVKGGADVIALGGGFGGFVNGGVKWNNQMTTTFVKGGLTYTW